MTTLRTMQDHYAGCSIWWNTTGDCDCATDPEKAQILEDGSAGYQDRVPENPFAQLAPVNLSTLAKVDHRTPVQKAADQAGFEKAMYGDR